MARKALIPGFRWWNIIQIESNGFPIDQFYCDITTLLCSVTQSCPTLCDPMDCSTPGFPVLHYLLELAQIHVH